MGFAVGYISDIKWNFAIPEDWKKLVRALAASHAKKAQFDDFMPGKGRGLIILLQYELRSALFLTQNISGPTGVGKTLTAEGLSEATKVALYGTPCLLKLLLFA